MLSTFKEKYITNFFAKILNKVEAINNKFEFSRMIANFKNKHILMHSGNNLNWN